jgi:hypothetical protein
MDKATLDILLSLAKPLSLFRKELVDNGVPESEATTITLEVFGFRKYKQESESPIPGVTVKH